VNLFTILRLFNSPREYNFTPVLECSSTIVLLEYLCSEYLCNCTCSLDTVLVGIGIMVGVRSQNYAGLRAHIIDIY
jgi:hypothetical protein